jgi:hypothetical protein
LAKIFNFSILGIILKIINYHTFDTKNGKNYRTFDTKNEINYRTFDTKNEINYRTFDTKMR